MVAWRKCCCCSVETASKVFSILGLVGYLLTVALGIWGLTTWENSRDALFALAIAEVVLALIGIPIYVFLIFGVYTEKIKFFKPVLIFEPLFVVLQLSITIVKNVKTGLDLDSIAEAVIYSILGAVLWMVFYSYRKQIITEANDEKQERV